MSAKDLDNQGLEDLSQCEECGAALQIPARFCRECAQARDRDMYPQCYERSQQ